MKNVQELNQEELILIDGGVAPGKDGRGCTEPTNPFLPLPPYGGPVVFVLL